MNPNSESTNANNLVDVNVPKNSSKNILKKKSTHFYILYMIISLILFGIYWIYPMVVSGLITIIPALLFLFLCCLWLYRYALKQNVSFDISLHYLVISMILSFISLGGFVTIGGIILNTCSLKGMNKLIHEIVSGTLLITLIAPIIEETLKLLMVALCWIILQKVLNKSMNTGHYYYFLMVSMCIGASFAMNENFLYVAFCEWNVKLNLFDTFDIGCSVPGISANITGLIRSFIPIPMHIATSFIFAVFFCLNHLKLKSKLQTTTTINPIILVPIAYGLHIFNNTSPIFLGYLGLIGNIIATILIVRWTMRCFRLSVNASDNNDENKITIQENSGVDVTENVSQIGGSNKTEIEIV